MSCKHWWWIAPANGPLSKGTCLRCGESREFRNSRDDYGPVERSARAHSAYCATDKAGPHWQETYRK